MKTVSLYSSFVSSCILLHYFFVNPGQSECIFLNFINYLFLSLCIIVTLLSYCLVQKKKVLTIFNMTSRGQLMPTLFFICGICSKSI